jgi:TonB-linked SusC/RagA family outer membrane protein
MKKISMLIVFLLFAGLQVVLAQKTITGTVTGSSDNLPLPGVTVLVKGTATGNTTGIDGKYSIQVPDNQAILQFSFIGFNSQEITVGNQLVVNVVLAEALLEMNEVVVTALGIRREAKSIGYAATQVNTAQIANTNNINVGNSLLGKVAGLNVSAPPSGPGGSSKIRIRGQSSFGGNNSPLIVINGVPINNKPRIEASEADFGDGLQSINPDDIESMTVLKGASAAALYGFRAKDGVIIITTKTGSKRTGLGIEINSSVVADEVLDFRNFQYEYGQGEFGLRPGTARLADGSIVPVANPLSDVRSTGIWSFGTRFDGEPFIAFDNQEHPYSPFKNTLKAFYNTGLNFTNSVALSAGNDKGSIRVSFSNTDATGIIPESSYSKKIIDMGMNYKFGEKLTAQVNANYSIDDNINPPLSTQDMSIAGSIWTLNNTADPNWLKNPYQDANGNEVPFARFSNRTNPWWAVYKRHEEVKNNRIYGNMLLRYQVTPWLYAQGRVGQDWYSADHNVNGPTGTAATGAAASGFNGTFSMDNRSNREINMDFLIGADKKFGAFGVNATFGGNTMKQVYQSITTAVTNFYIRDLYTIGNGQTKVPSQDFNQKKVNSLYGTLDLSFKDYLFLNGTARNDWFSTLNPKSNSYLYPSISGSFLFTQAFANAMPSWMNYGKLRLAYAEVGGDTDPYSNTLYYAMNANQFNATYPYGSINGIISPNPDLRPLKVKETEIGLELIFLDRRISLDAAVYNKNTVDEILNVDISNASGFSTKKVNVGRLRNQGIEMLLTLVPVRTRNFTWESGFNYSYNISKVLQLADNQTILNVSGAVPWIGQISEEVGQPLGSIRGTDFLRNDAGQIITVAGRFQAGKLMTYGSAVPKHVGGWLNTFTYKAFRLFTQIDFKAGHKFVSNLEYNFMREGYAQESLPGREGGVVFDGVNADGSANTTAVEAELFYTDYSGKKIYTPFIYNASFVRFRTLSLGADLTRFVSKTFIKGLRINGSINNFFMIKRYTNNLDPECVTNSSDTDGGIEKAGLPTTRSYGVSVNIKF